MFAITKAARERHHAGEAAAYPRFGGRAVRQSAGLHALLIALTLAGASAGATLAVVSLAAPAQAEAARRDAPAAQAIHQPVQTTEKTDRLSPPAKPAFEPVTCDGVWGNEPLECLLQSA